MALDYDDGWWDFGTIRENEPWIDSRESEPEPDDYFEDDREYTDRGADYEEDRMINRFDERNHYGDF